jgi:hypothetical protein
MNGETSAPRIARIAIGETGFERAAVWSAVGFACSYAAFDAAGLVGLAPSSPELTAPVAGVLAVLTAVGVVAFAATGAGVFPAVLLAYGPFAAILLRTTGPEPYTIPVADPLPFAVALAEPLAVALAGATAVGLAGYAIGRVVRDRGADDD